MRILILYNQVAGNTYADGLFHSLIQYLSARNFALTNANQLKEVTSGANVSSNEAVILHTKKKQPSFFSSIQLRLMIKERSFQHLVQIIDGNAVLLHIPQLIISNKPESFISHKLMTSVIVAVSSQQEKQRFEERIPTNDLHVIPASADEKYQPITWSEQQSVKIQYTQGREYFAVLAEGKTLHVFTELLKAFSTFKKWQQSSMKLVILGTLSFTGREEWKEKIKTYKFREDVIMLQDISKSEAVQILAGAYVFIHAPVADNDILPLLQSLNCETPCISFATESTEEYAGEAAIIIEKNNYDLLAEKMILLYKDEALRSHLIAKGRAQSQLYTKEKTFACLAGALSLPLQ